MERKTKPGSARQGSARKNRRRMTFVWVLLVVAVVVALLMMGRVETLYVLATLSMAVLLIVVALSDLGGAKRAPGEIAPRDDSAAISDGQTTAKTARL